MTMNVQMSIIVGMNPELGDHCGIVDAAAEQRRQQERRARERRQDVIRRLLLQAVPAPGAREHETL